MAESEDTERKRLDLVRNERLKLAAAYLNGIAIALLAIGGFAPLIAFVTGGAATTGQTAFALLTVCAMASVTLHYAASFLLKGLR